MTKKNSVKMLERLYSIIVPVYGIEKYIEKCIISLINQTYKNIEVILVNDGVKDMSLEICKRYKKIDSRIIVLEKENGGLVSARKCGAEVAKGDYICCVDGDDWISKDYIEKFDKIISKMEPDIVCCGFNQVYYTSSKKTEIFLDEGMYQNQALKQNIHPVAVENKKGIGFPHSIWAKAVKRDLYVSEQMQVNNLIKIGEDSAVTMPLLTKCQSVYVLKECLYYYRNNQESMTKNKTPFDFDGPKYIYQHLINRIDLEQADFKEQIKRYIVGELYSVAMSQFYKEESYKKIKEKIIYYLSSEEYSFAVRTCKYRSVKHLLQQKILKYHQIWLLFIIFKFKYGGKKRG